MSLFHSTPGAERVQRRRRAIHSFKAKINAKRSISEKLADWFTTSFGSVIFFVANALFFVGWIFFNSGAQALDPYPFGFLTMVVSLEAIFLSIIVLISQNRETKVSELREEIELYINTYAESEITKVMHLLTLLLEKNGIDVSKDKELSAMLKNLHSDEIERELESEL